LLQKSYDYSFPYNFLKQLLKKKLEKLLEITAVRLELVKDPTGAGDTFAGALVGFLARVDDVSDDNLVRAVHLGSCMASFVVEDFSFDRVLALKLSELEGRVERIHEMVALPKIDRASIEAWKG